MSYPHLHPALLAFIAVAGCSGLAESPTPTATPITSTPVASIEPEPSDPALASEPESEPESREEQVPMKPGKRLGRYQLTYYWVANEADRDTTPQVTLRDRKCKPIAKVSRAFRRALNLEGTGRLRDGRIVNVAGGCRCGKRCFLVAGEDSPYGHGVKGRSLRPFRSIAAPPHIAVGTVLYIPELDGLTVPGGSALGGTVHNGCVVAEDRGGGVKGRQLDLFTGQRNTYRSFNRRHRLRRITVHRAGNRCDDLDAEGIPRGGHG